MWLVKPTCHNVVAFHSRNSIHTEYTCRGFILYLEVSNVLHGRYLNHMTNHCVPLVTQNCYNVTVLYLTHTLVYNILGCLSGNLDVRRCFMDLT